MANYLNRLSSQRAFRVALAALGCFSVVALSGCSRSQDGLAVEEASVAERIQKVGQVHLVATRGEPRTGEAVFQAQCGACHASGALGSPKLGDVAAWGPRIRLGFDVLWNSALKGKGQMSAQSGAGATEFEIARAVVYMANAAGGKLAEPQAPEGK